MRLRPPALDPPRDICRTARASGSAPGSSLVALAFTVGDDHRGLDLAVGLDRLDRLELGLELLGHLAAVDLFRWPGLRRRRARRQPQLAPIPAVASVAATLRALGDLPHAVGEQRHLPRELDRL